MALALPKYLAYLVGEPSNKGQRTRLERSTHGMAVDGVRQRPNAEGLGPIASQDQCSRATRITYPRPPREISIDAPPSRQPCCAPRWRPPVPPCSASGPDAISIGAVAFLRLPAR